MASELIAHSAFGLMGYWLRAHSGSFRHTKIGARANVYPSLVEERYQYSETMKNNIVTHGRRAWILSVLLGLILGGVIAWTAWNSQILPVVFGVPIGGGALLIIGGLVYFIFAAVAERGVRKWKQLQQGVSHLQDTTKFILRKAQELNLLPVQLQMMVNRQQPIKECSIALVKQCEKYSSVSQ